MKGRRRFLIDFPPGYKLFTHTKDGRIDHYLAGTALAHFCCLGFQHDFLSHTRVGICGRLQISPRVLCSWALAHNGGPYEPQGSPRLQLQILWYQALPKGYRQRVSTPRAYGLWQLRPPSRPPRWLILGSNEWDDHQPSQRLQNPEKANHGVGISIPFVVW